MNRRVIEAAVCVLGVTAGVFAVAEAQRQNPPVQTDVFVSGIGGVHTYRIPAMLVTSKGTLLVFCEARKESIRDASPTDMVLRRSIDGGKTWLPIQTLVRAEGNDAIMNPCPVVDTRTGTILLMCINAHKVRKQHHCPLLLTSTDDGQTWSAPADLAHRISPYDDTFVTGPGVGIQTRKGRLIVPGYSGEYDGKTDTGCYSRVLFSDDLGMSWRMGAAVSEFTDESQVVELSDGRLMLNMRQNTRKNCRAVATSEDGGQTWSRVCWDPALNECPCQASLIRYTPAGRDGKSCLLFANPDNVGDRYGAVERTRMTIKLSYDEGKTWPVKKLIHPGPSSYSSLVRLPEGDIGLVYEGGQRHRREWIRFARMTPVWLTGGADTQRGSCER